MAEERELILKLGQKVTVIATGGMSRKIIPHCKRKMTWDGDLLLKGLQIIYDKNRKDHPAQER